MDQPLLTVTSHIEGRNAIVTVWNDRIEWTRGKTVSAWKLLLAILTGGISLIFTWGIMTRAGSGTEMIPISRINAVTTERDTAINDRVTFVTAGSTITMRCNRQRAAELAATVQRLILA